jgi:hypothetical protein
MPLYVDGRKVSIVTNSMMNTFQRCPKQADFKYHRRLKPRLIGAPLKRGSWVHSLLEEIAKGGDWKALHEKLSAKFEQMFDEEKEFYGDMPREIKHLMRCYEWHYKHDPWKHLEAEFELEATLPNGQILRGKVDELIENQFGLWLVDHKTHKSLPGLAYRILDTQSPRYLWLAKKNKIKVKGFIWNYIRWKTPSTPKLVYQGTSRERLSIRSIETDYLTFRSALKRYKLPEEDYADQLARLRSMQYKPGEPQISPFFLRVVFEKQPDLLQRMLKGTQVAADRMDNYDFSDPDGVERVVGRHCDYMCSYTDLCAAELMGHNINALVKQNYHVGDPMDYYHDRAGDVQGKGD